MKTTRVVTASLKRIRGKTSEGAVCKNFIVLIFSFHPVWQPQGSAKAWRPSNQHVMKAQRVSGGFAALCCHNGSLKGIFQNPDQKIHPQLKFETVPIQKKYDQV